MYAIVSLLYLYVQIHTAGMMTDLPNHESLNEEILVLISSVKQLLKSLIHVNKVSKPILITIAKYLNNKLYSLVDSGPYCK